MLKIDMPELPLTASLIATAPPEQSEAPVSKLMAERQALVGSLVVHGMISEEFSRSGALDRFAIDETLGRDALPHILIGDEYGGAHHLPTITGLDVEGRQVFSTVSNPDSHKKRSDYRSAQRVQKSGVFEAKNVLITDRTGNAVRKAAGSKFFPNEWTSQDVLEAIIATAGQPPIQHTPDTRSYTHAAHVGGVNVVAYTDDLTGKIVAARPERK